MSDGIPVPRTPVPGWTDGLPYTLYRANQAVHRLVAEAIDGMDVSITQLALVVHLDELGHLSASDLARRFRLTPQSVSTALGRLEALGWVTRLPHPVHRKVIWYEVTESGVAQAAEGRQRLVALQARLEDMFGPAFVTDTIADLQRITTEIDGPEPAAEPLWPVPER